MVILPGAVSGFVGTEPGKGVLGARRTEREGLWCEADVVKGVDVKGSQSLNLIGWEDEVKLKCC